MDFSCARVSRKKFSPGRYGGNIASFFSALCVNAMDFCRVSKRLRGRVQSSAKWLKSDFLLKRFGLFLNDISLVKHRSYAIFPYSLVESLCLFFEKSLCLLIFARSSLENLSRRQSPTGWGYATNIGKSLVTLGYKGCEMQEFQ